jgi:hypothetical protein
VLQFLFHPVMLVRAVSIHLQVSLKSPKREGGQSGIQVLQ